MKPALQSFTASVSKNGFTAIDDNQTMVHCLSASQLCVHAEKLMASIHNALRHYIPPQMKYTRTHITSSTHKHQAHICAV
jgi:hypothetical protein